MQGTVLLIWLILGAVFDNVSSLNIDPAGQEDGHTVYLCKTKINGYTVVGKSWKQSTGDSCDSTDHGNTVSAKKFDVS